MKYLLIVLMFFNITAIAQSNGVVLLSTKKARSNGFVDGWISLDSGWRFKTGDNQDWSRPGFDDASWQTINVYNDFKKKPGILPKRGIVWFRMRIETDSTLWNKELVMRIYQTGASEVYLEGKLIHRLGVVSTNPDSARYYSPNSISLSFPVIYNTMQTLAVRYENLASPFPIYGNASNTLFEPWVSTLDNAADDYFVQYYKVYNNRINTGIGAGAILCILYFSFYIFFPARKINLYFSISNLFFVLTLVFYAFYLNNHGSGIWTPAMEALSKLYLLSLLYCIYNIFNKKTGWIYWSLVVAGMIGLLVDFFIIRSLGDMIAILILVEILRISIRSLRNNASAAWIIFCFSAIDILYFTASLLADLGVLRIPGIDAYLPFALLIAPTGLAIYLGYAFGRTSQSLREKLTEVEQLSNEKQQILLSQNETLEREVKERTAALNQSLENVKSTQSQLIQSEKMASLGELTAGIAHEIQNPLNFVNNFSEVSNELLEELKTEKSKEKNDRNEQLENELLEDIAANLQKINHHGKRADAIVKGMLQHSRSSSGKKEPTDINALADEYLRLAYHGLRAKDKSFNAVLKTDYDENIGMIPIVPQDMGRVVLNLITNAFYAVNEKKKSAENYEPTVTVSTSSIESPSGGRTVTIKVADNGSGISPLIVDKIFQPFFTTKPTGKGTGLGLSLAYDIVKAHGGELKVTTREGEGSEFTMALPVV